MIPISGKFVRITGIGRRRNWSTPLSPANQHSRRDDDLNAGRRPLANQSHAERPRELSTWQHVEKTPRECSGAEDIVNVALRVSCSRLRTCRKLLQRLGGDPLKLIVCFTAKRHDLCACASAFAQCSTNIHRAVFRRSVSASSASFWKVITRSCAMSRS